MLEAITTSFFGNTIAKDTVTNVITSRYKTNENEVKHTYCIADIKAIVTNLFTLIYFSFLKNLYAIFKRKKEVMVTSLKNKNIYEIFLSFSSPKEYCVSD
jgi:hypothetical protein